MNRLLKLYLSITFLSIQFVQAQQIAATLDYCNFRANDTLGMLEYYLSFPANTVKHKVVNDDSLQSSIKVQVHMLRNNDTVYFDSYILNSSPQSTDQLQLEEYLVQNKVILPKGEYEFFLEATDLISATRSSLNVDFPLKVGYDTEILQISDIQNLKSYKEVSYQADNVKNGIQMISRNSNFFPLENDKYILYTEIYNSDKVLGEGEIYLVEARIADTKTGKIYDNTGIFKKLTADKVNPVLAEIDLSQIPTGEYNVLINIKDKSNKSLNTKQKFFQRYHPKLEDPNFAMKDGEDPNLEDEKYDECGIEERIDKRNLDFLLAGLMPMAKTNERSFAEAVANSGDEKQKINYLCYFFQKRERRDKDALTLFMEYKDRLEIAEKKYSTQTMPGYQTDRGRVFIQYGKPNRIDDEFSDMSRSAINNAIIPYEVWTYYTVAEPQPQSNVQFVFAQTNRANYNYEIVHSNAIGEVNNPGWKQQIQSQMMFQENPDVDYR